ncbi:MAG: NAD(P)/FAD-dependent oxidoreductase [Myxococcaceae bacterium]
MPSLDVLVVGGGHNALTAAAYLARSGLRVAVFERRPIVGGAVCTESDLLPGYRVDVGSALHILIHLTPIVRELELARYGLVYVDVDPIAWQPLEDGGGFGIYRDLEQTLESLHAVSPPDAEAWRAFVREWEGFARRLFSVFQRPPTLLHMMGGFGGRVPPGRQVRELLTPYGNFIRARFKHPAVQAALGWLSAQSGPPPSEPGSGGFLAWLPILHRFGARRAVGGSGALSVALARCIEAHGGEIYVGARVIRVERVDGRARRVVLEDGRTFEGECVLSGTHILETIDLVGAEAFPAPLRRQFAGLRVGNGFGMMHRFATRELPAYAGAPPEATHGMQLLCPSLEYVDAAYLDYATGRPSRAPCVIAMSFTSVDPSLAPPGKHLVYLWGQYFPYERSDGRSWDPEASAEAAASLEEVLFRYAPNLRGKIEGRLTQTPLDFEQRLGLRRGNVMHLEMGIDQMFALRPTPGLSDYRTPVPGLFLTGASTHPGGGVFGASGRSAARVILKALEGSRVGRARRWLAQQMGRP